MALFSLNPLTDSRLFARKRQITPENAPLSLNSLIAACNQSTNRDPVVAYDEDGRGGPRCTGKEAWRP